MYEEHTGKNICWGEGSDMKRAVPWILVVFLIAAGCVITWLVLSNDRGKTAAEDTTIKKSGSVDILNILTKAKTAKRFTKDPVSDQDLTTILQAGINAPSALNSQPWHFSVVKEKVILQEISDNMGVPGGPAGSKGPQSPSPVGKMPAGKTAAPSGPRLALTDATVAIIISGTSALTTDAYDCGLASQNMSIAAMSLGYAAKIVSSPTIALNGDKKEYFHKMLGIPDNMDAVAVLMLGVSEEKVDAITGATTRYSFNDVVTYVKSK